MVDKYMNGSTPFIQEMQTKIIMRYCYALKSFDKIKQTDNTKCYHIYKVIGGLIHYWKKC